MATELQASLRLRLVDDVSGEARRIESAMASAARGSSAAVEGLRLKQLEATTAARTLSTQLRRLQSSSTATEQEIREVSTALVRARETAAGFAQQARDLAAAERAAAQEASKLATSVDQTSARTAAGADRTATAIRGVSDATKNRGRDLGGMVNVVAEMGYSFGTAIPQARGFGMQLAMMGGSAYQLGAAFGPLGVGVGVVVGLLPSLISFFTGAGDEAEELTRRTQEASNSFQELRSQIRQMREEDERQDAARRGALDVAEQQLELDTRRAQQTAANQALADASGRGFGDRADAPELMQVLEQSVAEGRDVGEVLRERAAGGATFGRVEWQRSSTSEINLRNAITTLRTAQRTEGLRQLVAERQTLDRQVPELETALETARTRQRETEEQEALRSAPQRIRSQLDDLATVRGLSDAQRTQLLTAAERGRALPESLVRQLGPQAGRARELAGSLSAAERAAAGSRLDEAAGENMVLGLPEATTPVAREQVRRAVRARMPGGPATAAPSASPDLSSQSLATLERLAAPRRVEVDVRVSDDRVRVTTRDVDASAADPMGGQG